MLFVALFVVAFTVTFCGTTVVVKRVKRFMLTVLSTPCFMMRMTSGLLNIIRYGALTGEKFRVTLGSELFCSGCRQLWRFDKHIFPWGKWWLKPDYFFRGFVFVVLDPARKLVSAFRFCSATWRIRRIISAIAVSKCLVSGGIGISVGVAGPGGCRTNTRMNRASFLLGVFKCCTRTLRVQHTCISLVDVLQRTGEVLKR